MVRICLYCSLTIWLVTTGCLLTGMMMGQTVPDGVLAFVSDRSGNRDLYLLDIRYHHLIQLTDSTGSETSPAWSSDGRRLAFARLEGDSYDIYMLDLFSGERRAVVSTGAMELSPSWSPDDRQIVFTANRDSIFDLYTITLADGVTTRLDNHPARDLNPTWSPDGNRIAYVSNRDRGFDASDLNLQVIDLTTHLIRSVRSSFVISAPAWSPDGTRLAFASTQAGIIGKSEDIFAITLEESTTINLTQHPARDLSPAWSSAAADGKTQLAFSSNRDGNYELYLLPISASGLSEPVQRLTFDPAYDDFPAWRPTKNSR